MIKLIMAAVVVGLILPLLTSMFDGLCWFYVSETCTGLDYNLTRVSVMLGSTVAALALSPLLIG